MIDNVSINDQIHQFQNYIHEIHRGDFVLDKNYQISCLLDKLPPFWSKFVQEHRRTQETLSLRSVIPSIRIEDQHRLREAKENQMQAKINLTEADS